MSTKHNPFIASKLKVDRAKSHIREINNNIIDYLKTKPYRVVVEQDSNSPNHLWTLRVRNEVPQNLSAIIGDAIHNLRASLDLLASDLVDIAGENTNNVYFPFGDDLDGFERMIKKRHIDRAGENVVKIIRSLNPYKGGNELLRAIHDLDITDKHKALIPAMYYVGIKSFKMVNPSGPMLTISNMHVGPIKDGHILMSLPPANNVKVGQYFQPSFKITFGDGQPLQGEPIIETLHQFVQLVDGIIDTFTVYVLENPT
jgi:hypothetical protein